MPIPTTCPQCSRQLRVPDELVGKRVKCPGCSTTFTVEAEDAPAEAPVPKTSKRSAPPPPPPPEDEPQDEGADGDEEAAPRSKKKRESQSGVAKPGKVQAIAIMTLVGGIIAILMGLSIMAGTCFIYIAYIYSFVLGVMAIIRATKLLGNEAHLQAPPKGIAIMMIINILNFDMINLVLGILILVFLNDEEVKNYFQGGQGK